METKIIYLFNLHSGLKSTLPSDTLWGNICWGIKFLYGDEELKKFLGSYQSGSPELILSSTFPYYRNENEITRFFPRPILPLKSYNAIIKENEGKTVCQKVADITGRKEKKDVHFLEESFFKKIINGESDYDSLEVTEYPKITAGSITRNTIDRIRGGTLEINGTGQLFTEDEFFVHFESEEEVEAGLFFLAKDNTNGKLEAALRLLSHIGIGGNRSIGKGAFEFDVKSFEIQEPAKANAMLNLSLYYPEKTEIDEYKKSPALFNYQLEQRRGYYGELVNGSYQKPPVTYFSEGSVYPFMNKEVYGSNKIWKGKNYDIHHYGFAFMFKMKINQ